MEKLLFIKDFYIHDIFMKWLEEQGAAMYWKLVILMCALALSMVIVVFLWKKRGESADSVYPISWCSFVVLVVFFLAVHLDVYEKRVKQRETELREDSLFHERLQREMKRYDEEREKRLQGPKLGKEGLNEVFREMERGEQDSVGGTSSFHVGAYRGLLKNYDD